MVWIFNIFVKVKIWTGNSYIFWSRSARHFLVRKNLILLTLTMTRSQNLRWTHLRLPNILLPNILMSKAQPVLQTYRFHQSPAPQLQIVVTIQTLRQIPHISLISIHWIISVRQIILILNHLTLDTRTPAPISTASVNGLFKCLIFISGTLIDYVSMSYMFQINKACIRFQ